MAKSVLVNIGTFVADNNVRRSVLTIAAQYETADGSSNVTNVTVSAGNSFTYHPVATPSSVLVAYASNPCYADVTLVSMTLGGNSRPGDSVTLAVNKVLVIDDTFSQIVFRNPTNATVHLSLVQG